MIAVLARLQWMTLKGRVVRSIRLLRQPKYLVGSVVGFAWIGMWILRPMLDSPVNAGSVAWSMVGGDLGPMVHQIAALAISVIMPLPWLLPWGRLGLPFREAELTLLLQAPLTRRQVIQYGILKSEVGVMLSALVLSLVLGGRGPFGPLPTFLGIWLLFEFWHVNGKWRALFNLRQTEIPAASARGRRLAVTVALLCFYAALLAALTSFQPQLVAVLRDADRSRIAADLAALPWPPLLTWLVAPAWWLTAPMFAQGGVAFVLAALPTLAGIVAQREIVLRSRARFEESALEHAQKQETRKAPGRRFARISSRARTKRPFELEALGRPELAVVWKNSIRVSRVPWRALALAGVGVLASIALLPALLRWGDVTYGILAALGMILMILTPFVSGMAWNNDLRTDIVHLEQLRTWPISAPRFVLAEVVTPALVSLASATFGAGLVLATVLGSRLRQALTGDATELVLLPRSGSMLGLPNELAAILLFFGYLPLAAGASFLSSALQNLATLFVPAWMANGADRSQGVAAFGQRMVFSSALGIAFLLAMIPSGLLVGAAVFVQWWLGIPWSAWGFPVWGALAAIPLFVGGAFIVRGAAVLWKRLDPSQEVLEIGR